jgi:hypothetical protein
MLGKPSLALIDDFMVTSSNDRLKLINLGWGESEVEQISKARHGSDFVDPPG